MHQQKTFEEDIVWHQLVVYMMSLYLLADMFTGFCIIYLGIDLKVSLVYKAPIFLLLTILIGRSNVKEMLFLLSCIPFFFIGPFYQFAIHARVDFLFFDFTLLLKMMTPIAVFLYCKSLFKHSPQFALKSTEKILWFGFYILTLNSILGGLGFGKSTYKLKDNEAGSTGFIMAGNELGPAFLVAFGFALHKVWLHQTRFKYLLLSGFTVIAGVGLATKTAMLASILLVFLIPIVNERQRLYKLTALKIKLLLPLTFLSSVIIYLIFDILEKIGLYDRMMWFYQKNGFAAIILSGRDEMVADRSETVLQKSNLFEQVFGQGKALVLKDKVGKFVAEIDGPDTFTLYGIFTLIFFMSFYLWAVYKAHKDTVNNKNEIAPFIFIISLLLLCLSQLSGHIWGSTTLGILSGTMISMLFHNENRANDKRLQLNLSG
jgi:hypothetical protein